MQVITCHQCLAIHCGITSFADESPKLIRFIINEFITIGRAETRFIE